MPPRDVLAHRCRSHAVEGVVGEGLGEVLVGVGAGEHVAEHVIRIGEVLHDVAGAGEDCGQAPGRGIEPLAGDDAVAGGLLDQPQLGVECVSDPADSSVGELKPSLFSTIIFNAHFSSSSSIQRYQYSQK